MCESKDCAIPDCHVYLALNNLPRFKNVVLKVEIQQGERTTAQNVTSSSLSTDTICVNL